MYKWAVSWQIALHSFFELIQMSKFEYSLVNYNDKKQTRRSQIFVVWLLWYFSNVTFRRIVEVECVKSVASCVACLVDLYRPFYSDNVWYGTAYISRYQKRRSVLKNWEPKPRARRGGMKRLEPMGWDMRTGYTPSQYGDLGESFVTGLFAVHYVIRYCISLPCYLA